MKDGCVGLDHRHPGEGVVLEVLDDAQNAVTKTPWTHVKWYVGGCTWESTFETVPGRLLPVSGIVRTVGLKQADLWREPVVDLTADQVAGMLRWSELQVWLGTKYNISGLIADALIVPTRSFWDKLGWVPFGSSMHEAVCSVGAARAFCLGGWLPIWKQSELATRTPGDFAAHSFWRDLPA
jgi:hypothetical protein